MASPHKDDKRAGRLRYLFRTMLSGEQSVRTPKNAELFLEAIRNNPNPASCLETIIAGKNGLQAVRDAVRINLTLPFICSHTLPFLRYISDPATKAIGDGQLLHLLLVTLVEPPTLWNTLLELFRTYQLRDDNLFSFAWLALELLLLPAKSGVDLSHDIETINNAGTLQKSQNHGVRELAYRLQSVFQLRSTPQKSTGAGMPGSRHDNDFANFRDITIYPTTDEFLSTQQPFFRTAMEVSEVEIADRPGVHIDNQFRLLREDMLAELREDIQVAIGAKKAKRQPVSLSGLQPLTLDVGDVNARFKKPTLQLSCFIGLQFLRNLDPSSRKKFLIDNPNCLKHQSFGVLLQGKSILGFAFVERDVDLLARSPPTICLQFTDGRGLRNALLALKLWGPHQVRFVLVGTPVFAYEPVLTGLKEITDLPLQNVLAEPASADNKISGLNPVLQKYLEELNQALVKLEIGGGDSDGLVHLPRSNNPKVQVDISQLRSMILALTNSIALIQGPPGTGKSFIGAQVAKCLYRAGLRILVISYTNHALNQFLEDLMDVGIPASDMVRVGGSKSKCTDRTAPLQLSEQKGTYRRSWEARSIINEMKNRAHETSVRLGKAFRGYTNAALNREAVLEYLEFSDEPFYQALVQPADTDISGWRHAGKRGKQIGSDYLFQRWVKGEDSGVFKQAIPKSSYFVWDMPRVEREKHMHTWQQSMLEELVERIENLVADFNKTQGKIDIQFKEADRCTLLHKKVVSCTTTGAAIYSHLIRAAKPDVVLVEEAGEILESHILTALAPTVKQLICIGDHLQLSPKINNYALSVEKGDGFDLNRSLFERLIKGGASYTTLQKQHRMAREISRFPRALTYPELRDSPNTDNRPLIRGLQSRVVWINHTKPEEMDKRIVDRQDPAVKESKKNLFEAEMVLRCVKYLGQQGYSNDQIVVLAPYLGQIRVLQDQFRKNQHDPELSEMDKNELIRAGLISEVAAKLTKKPLRLSTIDNYQGEESEIVIASLTRCNDSGDIGFMFAPERLNVLLTRARNGLVMIGNMETFMNSKKGRPTWHPFFELLQAHGQLYDGLPVRCEKHPQNTALLKEPGDFLKVCPDGGCTDPCNAALKCRVHVCKSRCHRITDHSKTECNQLMDKVCERHHKTRVRCGRRKDGCRKCIDEDQENERRIKRDLQMEEDQMQRQEVYQRELQEIRDKIDHERRKMKYQAEEEEQKKTLKQHEAEQKALVETQKSMQEQKKRLAESKVQAAKKARARESQSQDNQKIDNTGPNGAKAEWEHLKVYEGAQSALMDELMGMIGLEDVKQAFLSIKSKVDTAVRQGISLSRERFGCCMLGNPGTGKTTVARLYARFLTEVGVIPGSCFKEATGSGLANMGVSGCKKLLDDILNDNGGVLFIDEAYQLTSGNNPGGGAVLDFLLAEVEDLTGKVVFVLAGYNKNMEGLFAHNPGIPSRFSIEMRFADYSDEELLDILGLKIENKYKRAMDCEGGLRGLYCRIISRRIGRGRGKEGFGNARTVENNLDIISRRQADRLRRERKAASKSTDDFLFTKEDLIGPEPAEALTRCEAWNKLQSLTGLGAVKEAVNSLVDSIQQNYKRELAEQPLIEYSLNKVFLGNPGTGKTTVAKLYGAILVALGLLSKGEVVVKNPSDFIGGALGQSEQQTKGILAATVGKVLVIDEAYGLYGGGNTQGSTSDPYKTAVIDTIVAEVQSVPGEDRCVLLLGYRDQMEIMFQNVNSGLSRRFPISSGFNFADFSDEELRVIFDKKVQVLGYQVTGQAARVAMEMLNRARNRPNFGNGGEIDIILDATKACHQRRLSAGLAKSDTLLEARDFDEDFDRAERSETNIRKLFEGTVGCEETVQLLEGYQNIVRTLKSLDIDPKENIPFNFLFRGPPGTGKTTTAKKMGKIFYDMGFLATAEVVERSATDLIGQYVGQTGPKVQQLLDQALGKVLFVDEAYRLAEGHFAKEAMDEIVDSVTKDKYHKKLIIILAGYEKDINRLMSVNPGLTSRFPAVIDFRPLAPDECISLLLQLMQKRRAQLRAKGKDFDLACLEKSGPHFRRSIITQFTRLSAQDNWASARDVQSIAKEVTNKSFLRNKDDLAKGRIVLRESIVVEELEGMLGERESRAKSTVELSSASKLDNALQQQTAGPPSQEPPKMLTTSETVVEEAPVEEKEVERVDPNSAARFGVRDPGVSDAVWKQLQRDRKAEEEKEEDYKSLKEESKRATGAVRDKIVKRLVEEERRRRAEEETKKKLIAMGKCPADYAWVKQAGGYRCAGGSHTVPDKDIGAFQV